MTVWAGHRLTLPPTSLFDASHVRNPEWSPSGEYLLSECSFGGWEFPDYEICVSKSDFTGLIRLKRRTVVDYWSLQPAWSPSGSEIVFRSDEGLVVASLPSGDSRLALSAACADPVWSPDGRQIVCALGGAGGSREGNIILLDLATERYIELTTSQEDSYPTWVKNGEAIVFLRRKEHNYAIIMIDVAFGNERLLSSDSSLYWSAIAVSPEGNTIVYSSNLGTSLHSLELETQAGEDLLGAYETCFELVSSPNWSHDGKRIAFVAKKKQYDDDVLAAIWIVDIASKQVFRLTHIPRASVSDVGPPSWSPDDSLIATSFDDEILIVPASVSSSPVSCN